MLGTLQLWPTPAPSYNDHEYSWTKSSPSPAPRPQQRTKTSFQTTSTSTSTSDTAPSQRSTDSTLHLPRILCLHGGGTNARIFHSQCRVLRARLSPHFRLVFADAPFPSTPGPDVVSVYEKWGPFKAWFPPGSAAQRAGASYAAAYAHAQGRSGDVVRIDDDPAVHDLAVRGIRMAIEDAMDRDDGLGATGDWVGVLGFSQGAKMAASLLLQQQSVNRRQKESKNWDEEEPPTTRPRTNVDYRFAVLLAGRAPMVSLALDEDADELDSPFTGSSYGSAFSFVFEPALHLPTIHVHGLKDPGLSLHRDLLDHGCEYGSTRLIEWEGEHRVPIKSHDVMPVVDAMLQVASEAGVIS